MKPSRSQIHAAEASRLAAGACSHVMFAIAATPWAYVAHLHGQNWLCGLLILAAVILGHRAFLRSQEASHHLDLCLEAEDCERRRGPRI
jgi:hypothetical protein